jgi:hypothetical protein
LLFLLDRTKGKGPKRLSYDLEDSQWFTEETKILCGSGSLRGERKADRQVECAAFVLSRPRRMGGKNKVGIVAKYVVYPICGKHCWS